MRKKFQGQFSGNNNNNSNQSTQQKSSLTDVSSTKKDSSNVSNPMKLHWMKIQQLSGNKPEQSTTATDKSEEIKNVKNNFIIFISSHILLQFYSRPLKRHQLH